MLTHNEVMERLDIFSLARKHYAPGLTLFFMGSFDRDVSRSGIKALVDGFLHMSSSRGLVAAYIEDVPADTLFLRERERDREGWARLRRQVLEHEAEAEQTPSPRAN